MRTKLTLIAIILYVGLFNLYIFELPRTELVIEHKKLFYNYLTLSMVLFFIIDLKTGFESKWHEDFNWVCICCVIINYIFTILTHHCLLTNPLNKFIMFNGSIFVATIMILYWGSKFDYFDGGTE